MKAGSSPLHVRTTRSATALLLAGGMLLSANTIASALDLGSAGTGSLGSLGTGSLGSLGTGSAETPLDPTAKLTSIANFRDVAGNDGPGYAATGGDHLRRGVIYRSNALSSASDADLATLSSLNIKHIYDLRGPTEISNPLVGGPDKVPAGAIYKNIPIEFGDLVTLASTIKSPEQGRQFMIDANRSYVTDPAKRAGFKQVLTDIANSDGPVIFHCSAGKDRTGWTAAILQSLAGAAPATVMDDYLLSNEYLAETTAATLAQIRAAMGPAGEQVALNLTPVLAVDKSYLEAGLAQMHTTYGDVNGYLTKGLGLDDTTIAKLTHKLSA
ncbi:tyrosine-protein phosphatase [Prescottella agglutinans]|uniref:Tyrosine-protein phosphatase n=1 Tax=Prescottella agglutinans TaxID=1644129 RepID=A0A438B8X0_9NOCA|nr:tyrosine-protein phosphatase [Prescottella agglutinans]RVW07335.1 tyrosine-protein phosphatase [Prescottella agglutinans]